MLYRIAIFSKYRDTSIYQYVSHITSYQQNKPEVITIGPTAVCVSRHLKEELAWAIERTCIKAFKEELVWAIDKWLWVIVIKGYLTQLYH